MKNVLLIVGIILIVASIGIVAYSNNKISECESLTGKVVQFLDSGKREGCAGMYTFRTVGYVGAGLGAALIVVHFLNRKNK